MPTTLDVTFCSHSISPTWFSFRHKGASLSQALQIRFPMDLAQGLWFFHIHLYMFPNCSHSNPLSSHSDLPNTEFPTLWPQSWFLTLCVWLRIDLWCFEQLVSRVSIFRTNPQLSSHHIQFRPPSSGSAPTLLSPSLSPFKEKIASSSFLYINISSLYLLLKLIFSTRYYT